MGFKEDLKIGLGAAILTLFKLLFDGAIIFVLLSCVFFFAGSQAAFTLPLFVGVLLGSIFIDGIRLTFIESFKDIKDEVLKRN